MFTKINKINNKLDEMRNDCMPIQNGTFTNETMYSTIAPDLTTATNLYTSTATAITQLFPVPTNILTAIATMATNTFTKNSVNVTNICRNITVNCPSKNTFKSMVTTALLANFTTTVLPVILKQLNSTEFGSTNSWDSSIFSSTSYSTIDDNTTDTDYNFTTYSSSVYPSDSSTMSILLDDRFNDNDFKSTTEDYDYYYSKLTFFLPSICDESLFSCDEFYDGCFADDIHKINTIKKSMKKKRNTIFIKRNDGSNDNITNWYLYF